jgi:hypothetical protein
MPGFAGQSPSSDAIEPLRVGGARVGKNLVRAVSRDQWERVPIGIGQGILVFQPVYATALGGY